MSHRWNLNIRGKFVLAFGTVLLLMAIAIINTIYTTSKIHKESEESAIHKQSALYSHQLASKINLATSVLQELSNTGQQKQRNKYFELEREIHALLDEMLETAHSGDQHSVSHLNTEVRELLKQLNHVPDRLIYLHAHPLENNLGLALATEKLNPLNRQYLGNINELIFLEREELLIKDKHNHQVVFLLSDLRNSWHGVINSLRLFFTIQTPDILSNYDIFVNQNKRILAALEQHREILEYVSLDGLDELNRLHNEYIRELSPILEIYKSDHWRADINMLNDEVQPVIVKLREIMQHSAHDHNHMASHHNNNLSIERNKVNSINIGLLIASLAIGSIIALIMSGHIIRSIDNLTQGARRVAKGDLSTKIEESTQDELGMLAHSFNNMIDGLNEAAESEARHNEQLNQLNASLEQRVVDRTNELRDAEQHLLQSEKLASIGQLAAGIAHEINNPVGFINSNISAMERYINELYEILKLYGLHQELLPADIQQNIDNIKQKLEYDYIREDLTDLIKESKEGVTRVKDIVQDLKDFSHVNEKVWAYSDLHHGITSTLNIVKNEVKYKADVITEFGELPEIECVLPQLNQVFMNLVVNAAHAIEDHGTITIRTSKVDDENICVEVSDTGKGIDPDNLKKIFEPFFTTKPIGKGTGLGLSLSYGIIQKHNGKMDVDSTVGKGTTFRLTLPVTQPEQDEDDQSVASA